MHPLVLRHRVPELLLILFSVDENIFYAIIDRFE